MWHGRHWFKNFIFIFVFLIAPLSAQAFLPTLTFWKKRGASVTPSSQIFVPVWGNSIVVSTLNFTTLEGVATTMWLSATPIQFTVPTYNTLKVQLWGSGSGKPLGSLTASPGAPTKFGSLIAGGGGWLSTAGGTASGGDINTPGNPGNSTSGGDAPNGAAGANCATSTIAGYGAGGGGSPAGYLGGPSGGYVEKTYQAGDLVPGSVISGYVGYASGILGAPGMNMCVAGGNGKVIVTWQ